MSPVRKNITGGGKSPLKRRVFRMKGRTGRRFRSLSMLWLLSMFFYCGPQTRHRALSTFFDGVPEPQKRADALADSTKIVSTVSQESSLTQETGNRRGSVHPPYQEKSCGDCHDRDLGFVLKKTPPDLCYDCHEPFSAAYATLHEPVAGGACLDCHEQHASENEHLLTRAGDAVCSDCHDPADLTAVKEHTAPQPQGCLACHNPHGSNADHLLK